MVYNTTDISNISDEIVAMMSAYLPDIILIFALLFTIRFFRVLLKDWLGF